MYDDKEHLLCFVPTIARSILDGYHFLERTLELRLAAQITRRFILALCFNGVYSHICRHRMQAAEAWIFNPNP